MVPIVLGLGFIYRPQGNMKGEVCSLCCLKVGVYILFLYMCWALLQLFHCYKYYNETNHDRGIKARVCQPSMLGICPLPFLYSKRQQSCSTFVNTNLSVVFLEETGLRMCSLPSWNRITVGSCLDQVLQSIPNLRHPSVLMNESSFIMCIKHFGETGTL